MNWTNLSAILVTMSQFWYTALENNPCPTVCTSMGKWLHMLWRMIPLRQCVLVWGNDCTVLPSHPTLGGPQRLAEERQQANKQVDWGNNDWTDRWSLTRWWCLCCQCRGYDTAVECPSSVGTPCLSGAVLPALRWPWGSSSENWHGSMGETSE